MKIIDMLNKIANGEELPKKIKYDGIEFKITKVMLADNKYYKNYINEDMECLFPINTNYLNDEIEIIEENNKIEKMHYDFNQNCNEYLYAKLEDKINEIIEVINNEYNK